MSTRGYLGIKKKSELKGAYNHFDSYISGLGLDIAKEINAINKDERVKILSETYDYIDLVDENSIPTQEQINKCKEAGLIDLNVADRDEHDWYCLLRKAQGTLKPYINKECPYMLNGNDFIDDDLFCEYAYIINLDDETFEIYTNGKHLIETYPLNDIDIEDMLRIGD